MAIMINSDGKEEALTQRIALWAVIAITLGLMIANVAGAFAASEGDKPLQMVIRFAVALMVAGAELMAAVALIRVMLAANMQRRVIGLVLFVGIAWVCIQNSKRAIHLIYPEFSASAELLDAQAGIAGEQEAAASEAAAAAILALPAELEKVRTDIAALKAEQRLMASQSPAKIKEAQSLLLAQNKYFGRVDGIRAELTESAMRARGEEIAGELSVLIEREAGLSAGLIAAPVAVGGESAAEKRVQLEEQARKARHAGLVWEIMLWVLEGGRSLGTWVYVATITAGGAKVVTQPRKPEPDLDDEPEPESDDEPPLTQAQLNGQKGARAKKLYADAADHARLRVPPTLSVDAENEGGDV